MVELQPISTPVYTFNKHSDSNTSSPSNSSESPTSLLSPNTPLLHYLIYPTPHIIHHPLYFPYPSYPDYAFFYPNHFPDYLLYPHPLPSPVLAPNTSPSVTDGGDARRMSIRRKIETRSGKKFPGDRKCKKVWKPKESSCSTIPRVLGNNCTTLMIKNIPNDISRSQLIDILDIHCRDQNEIANKKNDSRRSRFDFVYLPFDFKRWKNLGYAFVNFTTTEGASRLYNCWDNVGWEGSHKIRVITRAKLQGKQGCKRHFQISVFRCHTPDYLPVLFSPARDGLNSDASTMTVVGNWLS